MYEKNPWLPTVIWISFSVALKAVYFFLTSNHPYNHTVDIHRLIFDILLAFCCFFVGVINDDRPQKKKDPHALSQKQKNYFKK